MGLDFNESDILKDILNFKIVNRRKLEEKYEFKIIDHTIGHINKFLSRNNNGIIHKSKNYLYYFGKYHEKLFKMDDRDINMKMSFRRELITLILLLGKEKLNIYKFNKQIRRNEQNTKNIQNDLKQILKIYIGKSTYQENFYFKILQEILEVKGIKYMKKLLFLYIDQYTDIISMDEKYSILTYFILNMKNTNIKFKYRIKRTDKNEEFFIMIDKICKREKLKMDYKFITLFYRKLHRKKRNPEKILSEINKAVMIEKSQETSKIKKVETRRKKEDKVEVYSIAEISVNFENENLLNKKLVKKYIHLNEAAKIKTLVLVDVEENQILKSFNKVMRFFNFLEVVKVEHLNNFKKVITKKNTGYEQILIISNSKFLNTIRNFSDIPIFNFVLGKEKGALQSRTNILKQMIYLRRMMFQYLEFKKDRKIIHK